MKRLFLALVASCLLLTGCSTTSKEPIKSETNETVEDINETVEENQEEVVEETTVKLSDYITEGTTIKMEITYINGSVVNSEGVYSETEGCFFNEDFGECFIRVNNEDEETVNLQLDYGQLQGKEMIFAKDTLPILEDDIVLKHYGPGDYQEFTDHVKIEFIKAR